MKGGSSCIIKSEKLCLNPYAYFKNEIQEIKQRVNLLLRRCITPRKDSYTF